jgi:hypothetical protein
MCLKGDEIQKIKERSRYDDASNDWDIPLFVLKAKDVELPTLSGMKPMGQVPVMDEGQEIAPSALS